MTRLTVISNLDGEHYSRSPLHSDERIWPEKNCYVDLWIELLHSLDLEAKAMLGFTLAIDFEGDQWTFFKPSHDELRTLYGIEVQELTVWRPLLEHATEYLGAGKLISTEADSFWLPDTAGISYRTSHTKTTVVLNDIDLESRHLGYFHNAGYYHLDGDDFEMLFRIGQPEDATFLPLFAEFMRLDRLRRVSAETLANEALDILRRQLARLPDVNPVEQFAQRFNVDLPELQRHGLPRYHLWAFGTIRQLGSAFELAAEHVAWLESLHVLRASAAAIEFKKLAVGCKALILKGARAISLQRPLDVRASCKEIAEAWARGTQALHRALR